MKPNILFIMCDQLRYDCVGYSGKYPIKTPNIDALAKDGVFFENAYTTNPVCAPARQALFSGRRPEAHGGLFNPDICFPINSIPKYMPRYTKRFLESGYSTSYFGQWIPDPDSTPADYGYERYVSRAEIDEIALSHKSREYTRGWFGEPSGVPLEYSQSHVTARLVCEEIDRFTDIGKPWYIHVDSYEPHLPCRPSAPFDKMYKPDEIPKWGGFEDNFENKPYIQKQQLVNWGVENYTWDDWKETVALYYGLISQYDDAVGHIISHLKEKGIYENTVIIFTSDHGDMCGSHGMLDKHYIMYDDVCKIPLIITHKGKISPCRAKEYTQATIDFAPTLLDIAEITNAPEREKFHGQSLFGLLYGGEFHDTKAAVSAYNGQQFGLYCERSIRTDKYKYVLNSTDVDELYYLPTDPFELKNVIGEETHKKAVAELRIKLYNELVRCSDPLMKWSSTQLTGGRKL